ncbi:hypothetical protein C5167_024148 [Papaver somniferum]|uniref:Probable purine permease n=1 Tax=Papaver somniferum TaxID=3469 RepID=A0A4Y7JR04_PAPSO|nr:purine permease 3-like [Papaver somniferum]RZC62381.1 hypothetical protein C5167_024148 [Papaver somniferum]
MDIEAAASTIVGAAATNYNHGTGNHHNNLAVQNDHEDDLPKTGNPVTKKIVIDWKLILFCLLFAFGYIGGPMLQRLYFTHGGGRKWFMSMLQCVGFPVLVAPLSYIYIKKVNGPSYDASWVFLMEPKLFMYSALLGVALGLDNYMYSAGLFYLPVSTSSLLFSTQLAFTAIFAFIIVRQKFTFYSFNSVVLMTLGSVVLALNTGSDKPPGTTQQQYYLGFALTIAGAALLGLVLPLVELSYGRSSKPITYSVVMQFQFVLSLFGTIATMIGMAINNDFQVIPREGRDFGLGQGKYYLLIVALAVVWQLFTIGFLGLIYCTSSLFAGIYTTCLLPFTQVAASIAFQEKFTSQKGMSLALCLWGFVSYFAGEYKKSKKPHPIAYDKEKSELSDNDA